MMAVAVDQCVWGARAAPHRKILAFKPDPVTVSVADLQTFIALVPGLYQVEELDQFPGRALDILRRLLSGVSYSYNEVNRTTGRIVGLVEPRGLVTSAAHRLLAQHQADHPVIAHFAVSGDGRPHTISDFVSRDAFRRRALYGELYRAIGCEDQLSIGLGTPRHFVGICVDRDRWEFSDRDRLLMELLRSHLSSAYAAAAERAMLRQVIVTVDVGVVRIGDDGRSINADDSARVSLADGFAGWHPWSGALPDDLQAWVSVQQHAFERDPGAPLEPLIVEARNARLWIRFVPGTPMSGPTLMVRRQARVISGRVVRAFGLSPREVDVLRLLASGASSATIAKALQVSQHTVHRHLQNVYEKLGVRSRTAAVVKALEADDSSNDPPVAQHGARI
jgi:DNA-binding CsgD family transcriptional regulator